MRIDAELIEKNDDNTVQFYPENISSTMRSHRQRMGLASAAVLAVAASSKGRVIVGAFAPSTSLSSTSAHRGPRRYATSLYDILPRDDGSSRERNGDGDESDGKDAAIESARQRLEALGSTSSSSQSKKRRSKDDEDDEDNSKQRHDFTTRPSISSTAEDSTLPAEKSRLHPDVVDEEILNPPPLTTIGRARLDAEMECLSGLMDSDEPLSDLWTLWFEERGPSAAKELKAAEQLSMNGPQYWDEAEIKLRALIEEHGVHWAEPVNRLATLMYLQGRLKESKELCEIVLAVKPWHFGALSGVVMVCAGLSDVSGARMWADRRLPPLRPDGDTTERRILWVERAVKEALRAEQRAERRVWEDVENDEKEEKKAAISKSIVMDDSDDDAWQ